MPSAGEDDEPEELDDLDDLDDPDDEDEGDEDDEDDDDLGEPDSDDFDEDLEENEMENRPANTEPDRTRVKGGERPNDDRAVKGLTDHDDEDREARQEELLDEGVEETFPASDPVSVKRIT